MTFRFFISCVLGANEVCLLLVVNHAPLFFLFPYYLVGSGAFFTNARGLAGLHYFPTTRS